MPEVLDWQTIADPRAAVRQAVRLLRAGRLVGLPTETGYTLAASALAPPALESLRAAGAGAALALRGAAESRDWAPGLNGAARRLVRRLWPGPLALACAADGRGLTSRLPAPVREHLMVEGRLHLRAPAHEVVREVLRRLPGPLLLVPARGPEGEIATDAAQLVRWAGEAVDLVLDDGPSRYDRPDTVVEVDGDSWRVLRGGVLSEDQLRLQASCLIVFICTGNTCRSPLAEVLCKKRLAERLDCAVEELPARGFCVISAGLAAMMGGPAAEEAVAVAQTFGANLEGHRSQPLSPQLAAQADFLVAMTHSHVRALLDHYPRLGAPPRLLSPAGEDVPDPIGCDRPVYEACGQQIWEHLGALVAEIQPAPTREQVKQ
jgi:L-threonylcarbamoyladenylate synthase